MNFQAIREFRLAPSRTSQGISCDAAGAFIGPVPLLKATHKDGRAIWQPRESQDLSAELSRAFGLPVDATLKTGALTAIASALNKGEIAKAQLVTLHMEIPDPPVLAKAADLPRSDLVKLAAALSACGLLKVDWDSDEHPRWAAGAPDSRGGQFAPKGEGTDSSTETSNNSNFSGRASPAIDFSTNISQPLRDGDAQVVAHNSGMVPPIPAVSYGAEDGQFDSASSYPGSFHDEAVAAYAAYLIKAGYRVETEVPIEMADGSAATRIDILAAKNGLTRGVEVKTGEDPRFTASQLLIYAHLMVGESVLSDNIRISNVGLIPNQPLPPIPVELAFVKDRNSGFEFYELDPQKMLDEIARRIRALQEKGKL